MAKINSELEKDFMRNMELRAELSRMSYEATGGVRENYRNNENPNVNLGGQEALQQFKKINPLTAEMIREYKDEEINKYKRILETVPNYEDYYFSIKLFE